MSYDTSVMTSHCNTAGHYRDYMWLILLSSYVDESTMTSQLGKAAPKRCYYTWGKATLGVLTAGSLICIRRLQGVQNL